MSAEDVEWHFDDELEALTKAYEMADHWGFAQIKVRNGSVFWIQRRTED